MQTNGHKPVVLEIDKVKLFLFFRQSFGAGTTRGGGTCTGKGNNLNEPQSEKRSFNACA